MLVPHHPAWALSGCQLWSLREDGVGHLMAQPPPFINGVIMTGHGGKAIWTPWASLSGPAPAAQGHCWCLTTPNFPRGPSLSPVPSSPSLGKLCSCHESYFELWIIGWWE